MNDFKAPLKWQGSKISQKDTNLHISFETVFFMYFHACFVFLFYAPAGGSNPVGHSLAPT